MFKQRMGMATGKDVHSLFSSLCVTVVASVKHGNKPSCSIKDGECFDQLVDCKLLNKRCRLAVVSSSYYKRPFF